MKTTYFTLLFRILIVLLGIFYATALVGQNQLFSIQGAVTDTAGVALEGATVVLLNAKDSVLLAYGVSGKQGQFELKRINAGAYLLEASYLGYEKYSEAISLDPAADQQINKTIVLQQEAALLNEVEISAEHIPIQIKGDTIEYNANAFKTQPNAVVEDLLKQLPGVEVERNGNVKAQGKDVEHIYVDGKEFLVMTHKWLPKTYLLMQSIKYRFLIKNRR